MWECSLTQEVSEPLHTKSLRGRKSLEHFSKFNQTETKFLASFERAFLRSPSQQCRLGDVVPRGYEILLTGKMGVSTASALLWLVHRAWPLNYCHPLSVRPLNKYKRMREFPMSFPIIRRLGSEPSSRLEQVGKQRLLYANILCDEAHSPVASESWLN